MDVHVNGTRLWVETAGSGQPFVLAHGFGLDHRLWDGQVESLARRGQVVRYDLRGFGRSALPEGPYRHADDLNALLDHRALDGVVLIGLSLGGWVALNAALDRPARVRALMLVDAFLPHQRMSAEWEADVGPIWREAKLTGPDGAKAHWLDTPLFAPARAHPTAGPLLTLMNHHWSGWQFTHHDPETTGAEALARLAEVRAPTLVVVGAHDLPDFHAHSAALLAIPGSRLVTVPGAGHLPPLEAPEAFNAALGAFLDHVLSA